MKLLLDEHLSPTIAKSLEAAGIKAAALRDWENGIISRLPTGRS